MKTSKMWILCLGGWLLHQSSVTAQSTNSWKIETLTRLEDGTVTLEISGTPNTQIAVEVSTDLQNWYWIPRPARSSDGEVSVPVVGFAPYYSLGSDGVVTATDPEARSATIRFYRVRESPITIRLVPWTPD